MAPKTYQIPITFCVLVVLLLLSTAQSKPITYQFNAIQQQLVGTQKGQSVTGLSAVKQYLKKFGYLNYDEISINHEDDDEFDDSLESAIKTYQQKFHLTVTGHLDNHTVNQMMIPRCGVPDIFNTNNSKSFPGVSEYSFFPGSPKWPKNDLTYTFRGGSVEVPGTENLKAISKQAFQKWAEVTDFTFQEVPSSSDSDIEIAFYSGDHGDGEPFDGPEGILAHSFKPTIGKLHFDADESWSSSNPGPSEIDLESVAVHEIGHILGLGHSVDHPEAIMYPSIGPGMTKRNLQEDDILGIRDLYGLQ